MSQRELVATIRQTKGKTFNHHLRNSGKISAVMYGPEGNCLLEMSEEVTRHYLEKLTGRHELVPLTVQDTENGKTTTHQVLLQEIQKHPFRHELLHLDFRELDVKKPVTLRVPLRLVGESIAEKKGGTLQMVVRDLRVKCLPNHIPSAIDVDVTNLDVGMNMRVQDVQLPKSLTLKSQENFTIISVVARRVARAAVAAADEGAKGKKKK